MRGVVGPSFSFLKAGWQRLAGVVRRIDDSLIGDLLALLSLVAAIYAFLVMGWVLS
ncbi:hypothetical protein [Profundibacter sp.]